MEEMETPTEQAQEDMHHHAHGSPERWVSWAALISALLAALAAVTVLLAGKHANEAMLSQAEGNNKWSQFQAKSVKSLVLKSKMDIQKWAPVRTLTEEEQKQFKEQQTKDQEKFKEYDHDKEKLSEEAGQEVKASTHHMEMHEKFARGVTFFQVAIAMAAISVLSKRSQLCIVGLVFGVFGVFYMVRGLMM